MVAIRGKVLIAVLALVALVLMFELAEAQYGRGGYGGYGGGRGYGGYGGYGGGRGYGGRGGYGGGRGYGGYGGYGGGRGYGGYGGYGYGRGGYGGYRGSASYDPYSSFGGIYDDDDSDYSSYLDVYATASSNPSASSSVNSFAQGSDPSSIATISSSNSPVPTTKPNIGDAPNWTDGGGSRVEWALGQDDLSNSFNNQIPSGSNDLSFSSTGNQVNEGPTVKARERNILAPSPRPMASAMTGSMASRVDSSSTVPSVPSSTTTTAPEYVMINPTNKSGDNDSQDEMIPHNPLAEKLEPERLRAHLQPDSQSEANAGS